MSWRRAISLLAIIGVLLQGGMFVRHNAMMLGVALDRASLAGAFGEICYGKPGSGHSTDSTLPQNPSKTQSHCPDCLCFSGAVAVLPPTPAFYLTFYSLASDTLFSAAPVSSPDVALWPPGQGPPRFART